MLHQDKSRDMITKRLLCINCSCTGVCTGLCCCVDNKQTLIIVNNAASASINPCARAYGTRQVTGQCTCSSKHGFVFLCREQKWMTPRRAWSGNQMTTSLWQGWLSRSWPISSRYCSNLNCILGYSLCHRPMVHNQQWS